VSADFKTKSNDMKLSTANENGVSVERDVRRPAESITSDAKLIDAVKALHVSSPMPSLVVNGSGVAGVKSRLDSVDGFSEDPFQRTDSGSELGTKPPSLDGKSITSGTTFALDEKESLRPDDSASVKAAEDDDTFSGRGSIVAGSRIGSEAAARAYRAQFYEASGRNVQPMQEHPSREVNTPQSGSSGQQTTDDGKPKVLVGASGGPDSFNLFYRQTPDEKLLEALESPKDRIFLLRLEADVISFVKDSKEPFIDLPPCNSFCRMLTHKLADYYHMTHQVDAIAGAVRIFRTPFCRLPPTLTTISNPPTTGNTPPPSMPAMKIMRRGGDGDTGPSPSKATSETGSDGKDKALSAKEKYVYSKSIFCSLMLTEPRLSREEREAAYNKARERIFGKEEKAGDVTPGTLQSKRYILFQLTVVQIPRKVMRCHAQAQSQLKTERVRTRDPSQPNSVVMIPTASTLGLNTRRSFPSNKSKHGLRRHNMHLWALSHSSLRFRMRIKTLCLLSLLRPHSSSTQR
jgi:hypothetical protein